MATRLTVVFLPLEVATITRRQVLVLDKVVQHHSNNPALLIPTLCPVSSNLNTGR